jgi:adenine-specific DNA glycosylase
MEFTKELLSKFPALLLQWNRIKTPEKCHGRVKKDPYKIWLSEIILQQTGLNKD